MAETDRTDIVIVGWNQDHLTRRCFESIVENTPAETYRLIYVDNGSHREPLNKLLGDFPQVTAVRLPTNTGFPHGANVGLALALIAEGEFVVLLNNDAWVPDGDKGWLERWQEVFRFGYGAVGAVSDNVFGFQRRRANDVPRGGIHNVPVLVFFAVMLCKTAVRKVGFLDERFSPGNYEDFDYSVRLKRAGYNMAVTDNVWLHHDMHASHEGLDLGAVLDTNRRKFVDKWGLQVAWDMGIR